MLCIVTRLLEVLQQGTSLSPASAGRIMLRPQRDELCSGLSGTNYSPASAGQIILWHWPGRNDWKVEGPSPSSKVHLVYLVYIFHAIGWIP
jgi:hypothetical protein